MSEPARFYLDLPLQVGQSSVLPEAVAHHALRVLRLVDGDPLVLFNGLGGEYRARLRVAKSRSATCEIEAFSAREAELGLTVSIGQGLCASEKMDWLIEKAVELGAAALTPLSLARSVVKLSAERAKKRQQHWQQIVVAASQQCGRNRLMALASPQALAPWLSQSAPGALKLVLDPSAVTPLPALLAGHAARPVTLLIGPEGGLSGEELQSAKSAGFCAVRLGPRILRTETAALVAVASVAAHWDALPVT